MNYGEKELLFLINTQNLLCDGEKALEWNPSDGSTEKNFCERHEKVSREHLNWFLM